MAILARRLGTRPLRAAGALRGGLAVSSPGPGPGPASQASLVVDGVGAVPPRRLFSASPPCREASPPSSPPPSGPGAVPPPPPPPPDAGYAALSTRRVVCLAGPDAAKFLQGMLTSNIYRLVPPAAADEDDDGGRPPPEVGFYSGFLNAVGRVLHDVFVYANTLGLDPVVGGAGPTPGESFLIECSDSHAPDLMLLLHKYRLRNKIKFRLLDPAECQVWQVWDDAALLAPDVSLSSSPRADPPALVHPGPGRVVLRDPRAPAMGFRVLTSPGGDNEPLTTAVGAGVPKSDAAAYRVRRYLQGVAEGGAELVSQAALPLEANMDAMAGIDYRKGCYVGQELTIRTRHRGVVRKRVLPVMLYRDGEPAPDRLEYRPSSDAATTVPVPPPGSSIGPVGRGRSAGTFLAGVGNIGLGLCRLGMMTDIQLPGEEAPAGPVDPNREFLVRGGDESAGDLKVKAFVPDWLRAKVEGKDPSA